jgi:hypothetical protein
MERDACNDLRDALEMTGKFGVRARDVDGFAIAHLADSEAHSSF